MRLLQKLNELATASLAFLQKDIHFVIIISKVDIIKKNVSFCKTA